MVKGDVRVAIGANPMGATAGIVGINFGTIENCGNSCNVTGNHNVGGIAGVSNGIIKGCYNKGTIYGYEWGVGGITGYNGNTDREIGIEGQKQDAGKRVGYIINCYNNASVTCGSGRESFLRGYSRQK